MVGDLALVVCNTFGVALSTLQLVVIVWMKMERRRAPQKGAESAGGAEIVGDLL